MANSDRDEQFRQIADAFIDKANELVDGKDPVLVSTAMLYGAARFCAFTVASQAGELEQYDQDKDAAAEYYESEYKRMLAENLEQYREAFAPPLKYEHLMKKD